MAYIPNPENTRRPITTEKLYKVSFEITKQEVTLTVVTRSKCYPIGYYYVIKTKNPTQSTLYAFQQFQLGAYKKIGQILTELYTDPNHLELIFHNSAVRISVHDLPTENENLYKRCAKPPELV